MIPGEAMSAKGVYPEREAELASLLSDGADAADARLVQGVLDPTDMSIG
jgi:hypothetical protein